MAMKYVRALMWGLLWCITCFAGAGSAQARAGAEGFTRVETSASGPTVIGDSLVVPGLDELDEGQTQQAEVLAQRANTVARAQRLASRTSYRHLHDAAALRLAESVFPALIDRPHDDVPTLPPGQHITRFLNGHAAQVDLGLGRRALLDSSTPIAAPTPAGGHRSMDLALLT